MNGGLHGRGSRGSGPRGAQARFEVSGSSGKINDHLLNLFPTPEPLREKGAGNMELYHFCQTPLESGAVIKPGNWGRLMLLESFPKTKAADVENILFDVVLENVRLALYSDKPSRFACVYTCLGIESARLFAPKRPYYPCYKVELVYPDRPTFCGSWQHVEQRSGSLKSWHSLAKTYWSTDWRTQSPNTLELLSLSPIRIVDEANL